MKRLFIAAAIAAATLASPTAALADPPQHLVDSATLSVESMLGGSEGTQVSDISSPRPRCCRLPEHLPRRLHVRRRGWRLRHGGADRRWQLVEPGLLHDGQRQLRLSDRYPECTGDDADHDQWRAERAAQQPVQDSAPMPG